MIPPREKVLVCVPSIDRRIDMEWFLGYLQCIDLCYAPPYMWGGMSDIALARNHIANKFMNEYTEFDWMMQIDSDIGFTRTDWELLWEGDEEIVTAEYSKKVIGEPPAQFGLGFTRVHRSVFERMANFVDENGVELAPVYYNKGQLYHAYYTSGPNADSRWVGEDKSFFARAAVITNNYRLETRTRLRHFGSFPFEYPEQIPGLVINKDEGSN
jgi:hypothetical protein